MMFLDCFRFLFRTPEHDYTQECLQLKEKIRHYGREIASFDSYVKTDPTLVQVVAKLRKRHFSALPVLALPVLPLPALNRSKTNTYDYHGRSRLLQALADYKLHWEARGFFMKIEPRLRTYRPVETVEQLKILEKAIGAPGSLQKLSDKELSRKLKRLSLKLHPDKSINHADLFATVLAPLREKFR